MANPKKFQAIRGMSDILPPASALWHKVEEAAHQIFGCYGYDEIRTPILEPTDLFVRTVGESTAIVEKEMYSFEDKGGDHLSLRPEATASVVRAYIQSGQASFDPVARYYYKGPMFRRERPQKGRQRQFYQIGVELFGVEDPLADVEVISTFTNLLQELKLEDVKLELNSIGCNQCRPKYNQDLIDYLHKHKDALCEDCNRRIERNPMRAFDCKNQHCGEKLNNAPKISRYWCEPCSTHFAGVQQGLKQLKISFELNEKIVRGLDYYIRTAFEFTTDKLGAQSAIAAGGRYDGLVKELGGQDVPGVGYAIGLERLLLLLGDNAQKEAASKAVIYFAVLGQKPAQEILKTIQLLRKAGVRVEWDFGAKSLKAQMRRADRLGASSVVIVGEDELAKGQVVVRDMNTKEQQEVMLEDLTKYFLQGCPKHAS
ncbi:MAG: histidine--tRNA ligase [Pseudomonadota bacterium]